MCPSMSAKESCLRLGNARLGPSPPSRPALAYYPVPRTPALLLLSGLITYRCSNSRPSAPASSHTSSQIPKPFPSLPCTLHTYKLTYSLACNNISSILIAPNLSNSSSSTPLKISSSYLFLQIVSIHDTRWESAATIQSGHLPLDLDPRISVPNYSRCFTRGAGQPCLQTVSSPAVYVRLRVSVVNVKVKGVQV
jgi:hypothetical protein